MKAIIAGMLCLLHYCFAQSQEPLSIGSKMPDLEIKNIANYPTSSVRISELEGKAIVFYFWGVRCLSCVQSMPKLAELQKKFCDKLALFMVTEEAEDVLQKFFDKRTYLKEFKIPSINNQIILRKLFPLDGVPHVVWMGPDGLIKAITEGNELTETNLIKLVQGNQLSLPVKEVTKHHDFTQPIVRAAPAFDSLVLTTSSFSRSLNGLKPENRLISNPHWRRFIHINASPVDMYITAYNNEISLSARLDQRTRIILDMDRTLPVLNKQYCYEVLIPASADIEEDLVKFKKIARKDLDCFFNFRSAIEIRQISCYFVESDSVLFQQPDSSYLDEGIGAILYSRQQTERVVSAIKSKYSFDRQVVAGKNNGKFLTVKLGNKYNDLQTLKADLAKYAIRLLEGQTEMKVLVIRNNWE